MSASDYLTAAPPVSSREARDPLALSFCVPDLLLKKPLPSHKIVRSLEVQVANRREFLGLGLVSTLGVFLGSRVEACKTLSMKTGEITTNTGQGYRVQYVTRFPQKLTFEEYRQIKSTFENRDLISQLEKDFTESGQLLETDFEFEGDRSRWILTFRDESSFLKWREIQKTNSSLKADRERRLQSGFQTEIEILGSV